MLRAGFNPARDLPCREFPGARAVRSALGEPHRIEDNALVYTDMKNNYDLVFRLDAKSVIRGMELVLYVD